MLSWVTPSSVKAVASNLGPKPMEGCICFQLQCGKMLYCAGGQMYPSQIKHMGRKHILYCYFNTKALEHSNSLAEFSAGGVQYKTMITMTA